MKRIFAVGALALLVSGCGPSKPSDKDAQAALARSYEQEVRGGKLDRIENFALSNCVEAENANGVMCDVSGTAHISHMGRKMAMELTNRFRFSKASGEWVAYPD